MINEYDEVVSMEDMLHLITKNPGKKRVLNHESHRHGGDTYDLVSGEFS